MSSTCGDFPFRFTRAMRHSSLLSGTSLYLAAAKDVERAIDKSVTANFFAGFDRAQDLSGVIDLVNLTFVPLTKVTMFTIKAEVRPGEVRTRE